MSPARLARLKRLPPGDGQYRCWQTMRVYRKQGRAWSTRDLAVICGIGKRGANAYVAALRRAGYVDLVAEAQRGDNGGALYRLVRDTGPLAPRKLRGAVGLYDPNTQQILGRGGGPEDLHSSCGAGDTR